jgi:hypothetical protein
VPLEQQQVQQVLRQVDGSAPTWEGLLVRWSVLELAVPPATAPAEAAAMAAAGIRPTRRIQVGQAMG